MATAELHIVQYCVMRNLKIYAFVRDFEVLVVSELYFSHFEKCMWLTPVTEFKQIPDLTFLLLTKVHNM
jgi:hypothetical protein